jgi:hypothetical protein
MMNSATIYIYIYTTLEFPQVTIDFSYNLKRFCLFLWFLIIFLHFLVVTQCLNFIDLKALTKEKALMNEWQK